MRTSKIERVTKETSVKVDLSLDGQGKYQADTGVGFFDHMMHSFLKQTTFDCRIEAKGDLWVDAHHTVEDVGIALGLAFKEAIGDGRGIRRYGYFILPMDESLALCSLDISGRSHLSFEGTFPSPKVGDFDSELCKEFFEAFARNANITLHIRELSGGNTHHLMEAIFKAFGQALSMAAQVDEAKIDQIPSTKGVL